MELFDARSIFIHKWIENGGEVVEIRLCSDEEIRTAFAEKRFFVGPGGIFWVLRRKKVVECSNDDQK